MTVQPRDDVDVLADLLRRVRNLEASKGQGSTGVSAGTSMEVRDAAGRVRVRIGTDEAGKVGIRCYDEDGNVILSLGQQMDDTVSLTTFDAVGVERLVAGQLSGSDHGVIVSDEGAAEVFDVRGAGVRVPSTPLPYTPLTGGGDTMGVNTHATTTFTSYGWVSFERITHEALHVEVDWAMPAIGHTAELRLNLLRGGISVATTTAMGPFPSFGKSTAVWNWLHGRPIGEQGAYELHVEIRRVAGVGTPAEVWWPRLAVFVPQDAYGASSGGF